jgi:hypothetical protein
MVYSGFTLDRRLRLAKDELSAHVEELENIEKSVEEAVRLEWVEAYEAWYRDNENNPNPFAPQKDGLLISLLLVSIALTFIQDGVREADVRLDLKLEEQEEAKKSDEIIVTSPLSLLVAGLELEDAQ